MIRLMVKVSMYIMNNNNITKANGNMICSMASVAKIYAIIQTMKANFIKERSKDLENTNGLTCPSTRANGKRMRCVVSESSSRRISELMSEITKTVNSTEKASMHGQTVEHTMATILMTKSKVLEYTPGLMVKNTKVSGTTASKKASDDLQIQKASLVSAGGCKANARSGFLKSKFKNR